MSFYDAFSNFMVEKKIFNEKKEQKSSHEQQLQKAFIFRISICCTNFRSPKKHSIKFMILFYSAWQQFFFLSFFSIGRKIPLDLQEGEQKFFFVAVQR